MPQLDTMLRALAEKGARDLLLIDGSQPVFRFEDGDRPVSQMILSREQIIRLLVELTDKDGAARLTAGAGGEFRYRIQDGPSFDCTVAETDARFEARIIASDGESQGTAGPAHPATTPAVEPEREGTGSGDRIAAISTDRAGTGGYDIDSYLIQLVESGSSDLHLSACENPMVRLHGDMIDLEGRRSCDSEEVARMLHDIMPEKNRKEFEETNDTDFAYEIEDLARFRVNIFRDRKGVGGVFRVIPSKILTAEDLGLPKSILDLCNLIQGLVLVTGPTGSGKSTTLAAMVDYINSNRTDHVITIEDPIEFRRHRRASTRCDRRVRSRAFRSSVESDSLTL